MTRTQKLALAALASAIGAAAAAAIGAAAATTGFGDRQTTHTRITTPVHRIVVETAVGDIDVTAESRDDVEIERRTRQLIKKPHVHQYVSGGTLYVTSACGVLCGTVHFTIRAPAGVKVELENDAGDVHVHGRPGDVRVRTDVGDVSVDVAPAPRRIDTRTDAGDVDVTVPRAAYAVHVSTDAGDERVRNVVRDDRAAKSIRAETDAGDITVTGR